MSPLEHSIVHKKFVFEPCGPMNQQGFVSHPLWSLSHGGPVPGLALIGWDGNRSIYFWKVNVGVYHQDGNALRASIAARDAVNCLRGMVSRFGPLVYGKKMEKRVWALMMSNAKLNRL